MKLILAQGNPEPKYNNTRHNVGFIVIDAFADSLDLQWTNKPKFHALIAETTVNGEKVILAKPTTYYNETGQAARKLVDFYGILPEHDVLVIHDDLALPFGTVRTRAQGSDAGNNGIKSLTHHIGSEYHRIRIGVSNDLHEKMGDSDFVLGKFNNQDSDTLKSHIIPYAIESINDFIGSSLQLTSSTLT